MRAFAAAFLALLALAPGAEASLRAGAASVDITPPVGTPMFAYTARSGIAGAKPDQLAAQIVSDPAQGYYAKSFVASRGIHTRVRARALVLETDAGRFALAQVDLGGVPYTFTQAVLARASDTGLTGDRLLLSATHTHSSAGAIWPNQTDGGYALLGGDFFDARVFNHIADRTAEALKQAVAKLEPAKLGVATVAVRDASRNRNFKPFQRNEDVPKSEAAARAVSIDPGLTVVRVDSKAGKPIGAWSNFAIHPTSFGDDNLLFSGDNAAFAERFAERETGAVNIWSNAAEGDISPNGGADKIGGRPLQYTPNAFAAAHLAGIRVGRGIVRAWRAAGKRTEDSPLIDARRSFLDFDGTQADGEPVGPLAVLGYGGIVGPDGDCAPADNTAGPGQGRKRPLLAGSGLVPRVHPLSVWRIGRTGIVALPAEVTTRMGTRIRDALLKAAGGGLERFLLAGLANSYVSYTATPEEYDACHYEGSFTLYGRRQGARWISAADPLVKALLAGAPAPAGAPEPAAQAFGAEQGAPPDATPQAGEVVEQPAERVPRTGQAKFSWRGGDPAHDAPEGFVTIERRTAKGGWVTASTDDSYHDTVERSDGNTWTEVFQLRECNPAWTYRFVVRGRADKGAGPQPYEVVSREFTVGRAPLKVAETGVNGRYAFVRAEYPDPGEETLLALPRMVRTGVARIRVRDARGRVVFRGRAKPNRRLGVFTARVPRGSKSVRVLSLRDSCGNRP